VTLVVSSGHVLSQMVDGIAAGMLAEKMEAAGARLLFRRDVEGFEGRQAVERVVLDDGTSLPADLVVVGKGVRPDTVLAADAGIQLSDGILVNPRLETSALGVFAAGDVAVVEIDGRRQSFAMWPNAVLQGRTAGANMAGATGSCPALSRVNAGTFFGLAMASVGRTSASLGQRQITSGPFASSYRKIILDGERIAGAVLVGSIDSVGTLRHLLAESVEGAGVLGNLNDRKLSYSSILAAAPELATNRR
jgi:nitrite reductase (NADH) large subunit